MLKPEYRNTKLKSTKRIVVVQVDIHKELRVAA